MEKDKIVEVISEAVEKISNENYRTAIKLRLEDCTLKEIGLVLDKTAEAVKNDIKRGKHLLKKTLQHMGYTVK